MASISERTSKTGQTRFAVLYRHGKKQASKTFDDLKSAKKFRVLVEALGPDKAIKEWFGAGEAAQNVFRAIDLPVAGPRELN